MTLSSAFVRNGRQDVIAPNALARALHKPMYDSPTTGTRGRPNVARYIFFDPTGGDQRVDHMAAPGADGLTC